MMSSARQDLWWWQYTPTGEKTLIGQILQTSRSTSSWTTSQLSSNCCHRQRMPFFNIWNVQPWPSLPPYDDFSWALEEDKLVPVASTQPAWPQQMTKAISCNCTKGCNRNCSCAKKKIPCYIGCCCQGSISKCSHAQCTAALESEDNASDSDS